MRLRVVIFDVDGTLVDSAAGVVAAVRSAYADVALVPPPEALIQAQIGLSLDVMFDRLLNGAHPEHHDTLVVHYRAAYRAHREATGSRVSSPLFPGAKAALDRLNADPSTLLAIATGKSRRGLNALIADHGLQGMFVSLQTADTHPSKPNPSMIKAILHQIVAEPRDTVMVGDTAHDIGMARAAGVASIAVAWGYHDALCLGADRVIESFEALDRVVASLTETA